MLQARNWSIHPALYSVRPIPVTLRALLPSESMNSQTLNSEPGNQNLLQSPTSHNLSNKRSIEALRAHRGLFQTIIDRNEFQRQGQNILHDVT
jgi:hypothetical protein